MTGPHNPLCRARLGGGNWADAPYGCYTAGMAPPAGYRSRCSVRLHGGGIFGRQWAMAAAPTNGNPVAKRVGKWVTDALAVKGYRLDGAVVGTLRGKGAVQPGAGIGIHAPTGDGHTRHHKARATNGSAWAGRVGAGTMALLLARCGTASGVAAAMGWSKNYVVGVHGHKRRFTLAKLAQAAAYLGVGPATLVGMAVRHAPGKDG